MEVEFVVQWIGQVKVSVFGGIFFFMFWCIEICVLGVVLFVAVFFGNDVNYVVCCVVVIMCSCWIMQNFNMFNYFRWYLGSIIMGIVFVMLVLMY